MKIYIGADHRGFELKNKLTEWLNSNGYQAEDCGAFTFNQTDDYPDFAKTVARKVLSEKESRGILICGSGAGVSIAANKLKGIRCIVGFNEEQIKAAKNDDDINILALGSDFADYEDCKTNISSFLQTPYDPTENHIRRINKID
jgi:RpiB/LacA/LacB family sugar-phosphate isomerase